MFELIKNAKVESVARNELIGEHAHPTKTVVREPLPSRIKECRLCRYFGIGRASFYRWRHALADHGEAGQQIQMNFQFQTFKDKSGAKTRRFQYTANHDAIRIRTLNICERHNQANAVNIVDHVIATFPFRIQEIRTNNGLEFQATFHRNVEDRGIRRA